MSFIRPTGKIALGSQGPPEPEIMAKSSVGELLQLREESVSGFSCVEWRIPHAMLLSGEYEVFYHSDSFPALGERWHLRFYPNKCASRYSIDAVVAWHLVKEGPSSSFEYQARYKMDWKTASEVPPNEFTGGTYVTIGAHEQLFLSPDYNRSTLENFLNFGPSSILIIRCFLQRVVPQTASHGTELAASLQTPKVSPRFVEASTQTQSEFCSEKLSHDLSELMLSGDCSDFTIEVQGEEFRLHRGILSARTPVFQSMFRHEMKEKETGRVSVDDCDAGAFRAFVRHVYTGWTDRLHTDTVFGLFALADKYQVDELKSACLTFISSSLSVDTFCDVVQFALTYDDRELLEQARDFLSVRTTEVMKTVKWMNFVTEKPIQANELLMKALDRKQRVC